MSTRHPSGKIMLVVSINLLVAALHFVTGPDYRGPFPVFVNSFLIDILLPFALYFPLCIQKQSFFNAWYIKAALVFSIGFTVETLQYFGAPIFGNTFDPLDYVMYAIGVLIAAVLDTQLFPHIFKFWRPVNENHRGFPE